MSVSYHRSGMLLAAIAIVLVAAAGELAVANAGDGSDGARETTSRERAERLGLGTLRCASRLYRGRAREAWIRAAGPAAAMTGTLLWPVESGHFVRGYGSGAGDYHLGMDIAADRGAKVRAAAPGIVAYADNDIDGYGKMVLIVHPGGWITMYAHNSAVHVAAGAQVETQDMIAEVGSTGLSKGPHVHFELLYEGENCDAAPLMRPGIKHGEGGLSRPQPAATWLPSEPKPSEVHCAPRRHHPDHDDEP